MAMTKDMIGNGLVGKVRNDVSERLDELSIRRVLGFMSPADDTEPPLLGELCSALM